MPISSRPLFHKIWSAFSKVPLQEKGLVHYIIRIIFILKTNDLYNFSSKRTYRYIISTNSVAPAFQVHLKIFRRWNSVYPTYVYTDRI